jgi:phosphatidylglycerol:prolipoprotein diacylglycerol transferase
MIPYFTKTVFDLGPIPLQVWGFMVSLGIVVGSLFGYRLAKKYNLSTQLLLDVLVWALVGGMLGARIVHILFYDFGYYQTHVSEIVKVWHGGMSSLGGFVGASIGAWLFLWKHKTTWKDFLPYADIGVWSLWLGWGIGRIGCFLIHDHPGTLTHFVLAVKFPEGARHDLGLYDSLVGFCIFIVCFILYKSKLVKIGSGVMAKISILLYALARFWLDFLRAKDLVGSDVRYMSLTPAQWGMLLVMVGLIGLFVYDRVKSSSQKV